MKLLSSFRTGSRPSTGISAISSLPSAHQVLGCILPKRSPITNFKIAGGAPGVEVSWQVTGVRQDAYAKANPMVVEEEKNQHERGYYIHPELYGAPEEKGASSGLGIQHGCCRRES